MGLVVAAAKIPETFAPGLAGRSALDQGLVTALATGVHYLLAVGAQEALQAAFPRSPGSQRSLRGPVAPPATGPRPWADLAAIPVGLALSGGSPARPGEAMARAALRQVGWRATTTGLGGLVPRGCRGRPCGSSTTGWVLAGRWPACRSPSRSGWRSPSWSTASAASRCDDDDVERPAPPPLHGRWSSPRESKAASLPSRTPSTCCPVAGRRLAANRLPGGPHLWRLVAHGACLGLLARAPRSSGSSGDARHRGRGIGRGAGVRW